MCEAGEFDYEVPEPWEKRYHAFPVGRQEFRRLPPDAREAILELARRAGCEAELQKWLKRN